ncbi:hypothetical protein PMIN07_011849 [Paraphaeosphaeria minitans]
MKIGNQRPTARDGSTSTSTSTSTQQSASQNFRPAKELPHLVDVPATSSSSSSTSPPQTHPRVLHAHAHHHEAPRTASPQPTPTPTPHHGRPISPHPHPHPPPSPAGPRAYAADSPIALLRHINAAYPPIIDATLHMGMLVKDLHEKMAVCRGWCEAAVEAGIGDEPAVRGTLAALGRLRFVVPRGVGANWIGLEGEGVGVGVDEGRGG